jgi:HemK-like putative methylase
MVSKKLKRLDREKAWLKQDRPDYYAQGIKRLESGEPIDYVIGWREFLGCKIDLSARPLIPRAETEFWVGEAIKELSKFCEVAFSSTKNDFSKLPRAKAKEEAGVRSRFSGEPEMRLRTPLRVLDLFSGSGCIGLAVIKHAPNAKVTFAEKDSKLCAQIKKNLKLNPVKSLRSHGVSKIPANRAKVIQTDLFKPYFSIRQLADNFETLQKSGKLGRFDIIFANPPYIPTKKSKVQKSVKDWEPKAALYAGPDGLDIIKKFLKQAKDYLNPNGRIYLEFGFGQKLAITKLLRQFGYTHYQFNKDQFGKYRWVVIELT